MSELSQLELEAAAIDQSLADAEFKQPEAAELPSLNIGYKPMIIKALSMPVTLISQKIPFTPIYFNEQTISDIADSIIKVADIEQWELQKLIGDTNSRTGAWAALAFTIGVPSFMFYLALQESKATQKPVEKEVKQAAPDTAEQPTSFHG